MIENGVGIENHTNLINEAEKRQRSFEVISLFGQILLQFTTHHNLTKEDQKMAYQVMHALSDFYDQALNDSVVTGKKTGIDKKLLEIQITPNHPVKGKGENISGLSLRVSGHTSASFTVGMKMTGKHEYKCAIVCHNKPSLNFRLAKLSIGECKISISSAARPNLITVGSLIVDGGTRLSSAVDFLYQSFGPPKI